MFDTVEFYLLQEDYPDINFLNEMPKYIYVHSEGTGPFGEYLVGNFGGYKVVINRNKVSFTQCSLARFKFNDNLKTLGRSDTQRLIEQMENEIHLPLREANLTRIDIAQHIPMKYNPELYFPLLGDCRYYTRLEQPNGINYQNTKRAKVFYNKGLEQAFKNKPMSEIYEGRKLLRYELRFMKRLPEQFYLPKVPLRLLFDDSFHKMLVGRWKREYLNIKKISVNTESLLPTGSSKNLMEQLAARTLIKLGQNNVSKLIKEWQETGRINKKQAFDLRQSVQKMGSSPDFYSKNELVSELDKKIKEASRFF